MHEQTLKLFPQEFDSFVPDRNKKYFINFRFLEEQLTEKTKDVVINFLRKLERNTINFEIVSPLPKCIFGINQEKILKEFEIPKNCSRCPFLSSDGDDSRLVFCNMMSGGRKTEYSNREKLFADVEKSYDKLEFLDRCKSCLYGKRNDCKVGCVNKKRIDESSKIKKIENLWISEKDKKFLIINKDKATWDVVDEKTMDFLMNLNRSTFKNLTKSFGYKFVEEKIIDLYKRNFVSIDNKELFSSFRSKPLSRYPNYFVIHTTETCNLRCKYCYANATSGKNMPLDIFKKTIDKALDLPTDNFTFLFHGGEPLLCIDTIEKIVAYGKRKMKIKRKQATFIIQTNGTLINKQSIDFAKKHDVKFGISLDGPREIHDANRIYPNGSSSYESVIKGIKFLNENKVPYGTISVISDSKVIDKMFNFLIENEIFNFKFNHYFIQGRAKERRLDRKEQESFAKEHVKFLIKILDHNKNSKRWMEEQNMFYTLLNLISRDRGYMCMRSPCGAGNSTLGIDVDGNIYPCDEMADEEKFLIGNINEKRSLREILDDSPIIKRFINRTVENIPKCSKCLLRTFCGGGCTNNSYRVFDSLRRESEFCDYYRTVYKELMWLIHERKDDVNSYLKIS